VQLTGFIGREKELAEIKRLLEKTHLLTLTGAGGSGKTRLALEAAGELPASFEAGIWLVELAPILNPELLPQTVAAALSLRETVGQTSLDRLLDYLEDKSLLLLLDNCEHLLEGCAGLTATLLKRCPRLKILATSREGLNLAGEIIWTVPPLTVPDQAAIRRGLTLAELTGYESTRLFLNRAGAAWPDFKLTSETSPDLAWICLHLDGIPLALELAAARVKVLSLAQINARLAERFKLLTGGSRTLLPRHRTLTTLIDWSYNLLDEPERKLLGRLSLFRGGCNLEAVEQVCQGAGVSESAILDLLTSLVNKSLALAEEKSGEIRYRLLETIQEYARLKLLEKPPEARQFEQQMVRYFLNLTAELEPRLKNRELAALRQLDREYDNLRALLEQAIQTGEAEKALELCSPLGNYWYLKGYYQDGKGYLERSLALPGGQPTPARSQVCWWLGLLLFFTGESETALNCLNQGLSIARQLDYRPGMIDNLHSLGGFIFRLSDFREAIPYLQESLSLAQGYSDKARITAILNTLGQVSARQGDYAKARTYTQSALELAKESGDKWEQTTGLNTLGLVACYSGAYREAENYHQEALVISRAIEFTIGIHETLELLGRVAIYRGDYQAGTAYLEEALAMSRESNNRRAMFTEYSLSGLLTALKGDFESARPYLNEAILIAQEVKSSYTRLICLGILGWIALKEGDPSQAGQLLRESLELCGQVDSRGQAVEVLAVLVAAWQAAGRQRERTVQLAGTVESLQNATGHRLPPAYRQVYAEALTCLREQLLPAEFEAAWQQGRQMGWEEAVRLAVEPPPG
jgi:predicted ATPase